MVNEYEQFTNINLMSTYDHTKNEKTLQKPQTTIFSMNDYNTSLQGCATPQIRRDSIMSSNHNHSYKFTDE